LGLYLDDGVAGDGVTGVDGREASMSSMLAVSEDTLEGEAIPDSLRPGFFGSASYKAKSSVLSLLLSESDLIMTVRKP